MKTQQAKAKTKKPVSRNRGKDPLNNKNISFEAALTNEEMLDLEKRAQGGLLHVGVTRRMMLGVLTRSKKQLVKAVKDDDAAEAFMEGMECAKANIEWLKQIIDMIELGQCRLVAAMAEARNLDLRNILK